MKNNPIVLAIGKFQMESRVREFRNLGSRIQMAFPRLSGAQPSRISRVTDRLPVLLVLGAFVFLQSLGAAQKSVPAQELSKDTPSFAPVPALPLDSADRNAIEEAISQKKYAFAEEKLANLIEQNPSSPPLLALLGRVFFMDAKPLNAAVALKKLEKLQPLKEEDRFLLAMSYIVLNRRDWARPELEKLAQANLKNPKYAYWLGRLDYDDSRYAEAIEKLKNALALDPSFVKAYDNMALCYEGLGDFDEAIKTYEKANELNQQQTIRSAWPPLNYGTLLLKRGRYEEAESLLHEALGYDAKLAQTRFQLGNLLEKQKRYKEAIDELNSAATLDPSYPEPHYVLARIYRITGDSKSAEAAVQTFQRLKLEKQKLKK